jgi:ABC-2 type transport system permease protein
VSAETAAPAAPTAAAAFHQQPVAQIRVLARRSVLATLRQPPVWFPAILFPLLLAAVNASAFNRATGLPGFPEVDSFLDFLLPASMIQGVMFGAVAGGSDIALDIEDGFFERLLASPIWRPSILIGRLAGGAVLGAIQAVLFISVFSIFGARVHSGLPGLVTLVLLAMVMAIAIGGVTAAVGVRTGSQETVQNSFPLIFILLFLSSAFFPTELMTGWYQTMAELNPITWVIDAARQLVIAEWSWREAGIALGTASALAVATVSLAARQLRLRLADS